VRASQGDLKNAIEELASEWDGVAGIYLYDMASGETITVNPNTVFSGASVLKVPIMLQVHLKLPVLDDKEQVWLREMILDSNNLSANALLAHSAGGISTEDALEGVRQMTATMQQLGLKHTYQNLPYESGDYLIKVRKLPIPKGPAKEGTAPYTEADPYVRTTPAEIGSLFVMLTECAQGKGRLLKEFGTALTETRCGEMLKLLRSNHDTTRMVAGLPAGTKVAHKSGWVEDMQADVGLVESPGGNYVLAVYLYQQQRNSYLSDNEATPWLAAFSRLVYSGYNPGQE
jgi:beta-lactamase class A